MKMSKNTNRLIISFGISLLCAWGTHLWYVSGTTSAFNYENQSPIARLSEMRNEVQRKPLRRLIWQDLGVNDSLYSGEQIRTQINATATIEILDTGALIELEPGSLITLEKDDGKLQLDFLEGHLFVKSSGTDDNFKLKSGDQEISLNGAELSVGRSSTGQTDIQVFKGQVEGVSTTVDPFEPVSPTPYSEVYVSSNDPEGIVWEWKKDLEPDSLVQLEVGSSRTKLSPFSNFKREGNRLRAALPPGEHYWRLTATHPSGEIMKSQIYRVKVLAKKPPVPFSPENKSVVKVFNDEPVVAFRWANPGRLVNTVLEIAESIDFKTGYRTVSTEDREFAEFALTKPGTYFWRVTGYLKDNQEPLSSPILTFTASIDKALERPVLISPENGFKVQGHTESSTILLKWKPATGAKEYKVTITDKQNNTKQEHTTLSTQLALTSLEPGQYEWKVTAHFEDTEPQEKKHRDSENWSFAVLQLPEIRWKSANSNYFYDSETPELFAEWTAPISNVATYRVKIRALDESEDTGSEELVTKPFVRSKLKSDGSWLVVVEALDANNSVVARSREKRFDVQMAPLPPAPTFVADLPSPIRATGVRAPERARSA